jgi:FkbM family methyltransferase
VYAFEALPSSRAALSENICLNGLDNVVVLPFAILDKNGPVEFFASVDGNIGGSSLSKSGLKSAPISVQGRTIDSLLASRTISACDVLKMDIEGAEILALKGMTDFFKNCRPRAALVEISDKLLATFNSSSTDVIEFFSDLGYLWFESTGSGFIPVRSVEVPPFVNWWALDPDRPENSALIDA